MTDDRRPVNGKTRNWLDSRTKFRDDSVPFESTKLAILGRSYYIDTTEITIIPRVFSCRLIYNLPIGNLSSCMPIE